MARVFLSYAREDAGKAQVLAHALEKAGHTVWWDRHIQSGAEYALAIEQALSDADAILVLWSKVSVNSAWVRDEAEEGRDSGRLVPVVLDECRTPMGFRQFQALDLSGWSGKGSPKQLGELLAAIGTKTGAARSEPAGDERPSPRVPAGKVSKKTALAGLLVVALLAIGAWLYLSRSPLRATTPTVAVLPFADLSPGRNQAYFAEGVAEEILSTLAAHGGIKVLGRTSARQIDKGADSKDLRRRLGITHLLEGSARSAGEQLRVNVRLIDTSDGSQLWEEKYQGRPGDVFAVQDRIAAAVVQRLQGTLTKQIMRVVPTTSAETYQTYLASRALMRSRTEKSLREAFQLARKVIASDPDYAQGHALISELYYLLSNHIGAYGSMPLEQARRLGIPHAKQAIRLAPELADGYGALGLHLSPAEALAALRRAVALDPSRGDFRNWLGFALNQQGRHDEALAQYRAGAEIDPLAYAPVIRFAHALAAAGEHSEAVNVVRQFVARGGDDALQHSMMVPVATWQADPSAVIAYGRTALARDRVRHQILRLFLAAALNALGQGQQAAAVLLPMQDLQASYYRGDVDRLRRNIAAQDTQLWKRIDGSFAFVHLAAGRDWPTLVGLYDERGSTFDEFCMQRSNDAVPFVLALRAQGRADEAGRVLDCLRKRLAVELRNKGRHPVGWPGDLEFQRAGLAALEGDRDGAMRWLDRAVDRGWLGQPYSSRLADYPQFDGVRADPRLAPLQQRIDAKIAKESREVG